MSPDRLTLTRSEALRRRKEEEQQKRDKLTQKRVRTPKPAPAPKAASRPKAERVSPAVSRSRFRARYDVAVMPVRGPMRTVKAAQPSTFSVTLPKLAFGPRWLSLLLAIACLAMTYLYLTEPYFLVQEAVIHGNQRLSAEDINTVLGIMDQPAALLNSAQIEYNIVTAFPDLYSAHVQIDLPATVTITVAERQPVAAWVQDGFTVWVDAEGYGFPPRGPAEGLATIVAADNPPILGNPDLTQTVGSRPFLTPEFSAAITTLAPQVPEGATLVYNSEFGLGWSDPRGWQAYFGKSNTDMTIKLLVYQTLVENLMEHGVQPSLISVAYPNSPFYRVSKSD